jgi:hypothetical protein
MRNGIFGLTVIACAALAAIAGRAATQSPAAAAAPAAAKAEERPEVPPPPFTDGIFPCSECHKSLPVNRIRRKLEFHDEIQLKHDVEHRWCLDCHSAENRDMLHLASGELVPFDESYRLCGQCHGEKYRDWRAGVHGRRIGDWNGHKQYLLCPNCHNPHQPRFKPLEPKAAPSRPTRPGM